MEVNKDVSLDATQTCMERFLRKTGIIHKDMTVPNWKYIRIIFVALFSSTFSSCFLYPFLPDLVLAMGYREEEKGYYFGLIASSVFAGRAVGSYFWGWLSDIKGRRLVLLVTIALNGIFSFCFGFCNNLPLAMIFRFLSGLSNGTVVTAKSVLYDISDNTNQALGMSTITLSWGLGLIIGPTVGGFVASPAQKFPNVFDKHGFFAKYAFLLPSALTSLVCLIAFLYVFFTFKETLSKTDRELNVASSELSVTVGGIQKPRTHSQKKRYDSNMSLSFNLAMQNFVPDAESLSSQTKTCWQLGDKEVDCVSSKDISQTMPSHSNTSEETTALLDSLHIDARVSSESTQLSPDLKTNMKDTLWDENFIFIDEDYENEKLKIVDETYNQIENSIVYVTSNDKNNHTNIDTLNDMKEKPCFKINSTPADDENNHGGVNHHTETDKLKNVEEMSSEIKSTVADVTLNDEDNHSNRDNSSHENGTTSTNKNIEICAPFIKNNHHSDKDYNSTNSNIFHPESVELAQEKLARSQEHIAKGEQGTSSCIQCIRRTKLVMLLSNSDVRSSVMMYTIFSFGVVAFEKIFIVWLSTKPRLDGIGFDSNEIGLTMGVVAAPLMIAQLLFFSPVVNKLGIKWTYVVAAFFIMVPVQIMPLLHLVYNDKVLLWVLLIVLYTSDKAACNFCFASTSLLINNTVTPEYAGAVNGLAMTLTALARTMAPSVAGSIFAWSVTHGSDLGVPFDVSFCFVLIGLTFVCSILQGVFLPSHLNRQKK